jgi:hypothetical protein
MGLFKLMGTEIRATFRKKIIGGANIDHVARGHCEGEGAGGPPARSTKLHFTK